MLVESFDLKYVMIKKMEGCNPHIYDMQGFSIFMKYYPIKINKKTILETSSYTPHLPRNKRTSMPTFYLIKLKVC